MPTPDNTHLRGVSMVWLDLDDTLIDFKSASVQALRDLYRDEHLDRFYPRAHRWIEAYEAVNYMLWQQFAADGVDQATLRMERFRRPLVQGGAHDTIARAIAARVDSTYLDHLAEYSTLLPGAMTMLEGLHAAGYPIGVLTNGFSDVQHRKLAVTGLDKMVDIMVLSDEAGVQKPHRELFEYAMRRAGQTDAAAQLMIGDNVTTDIGGAVSAGWQAILVDRGLPLPMTRANGYTIVRSLGDAAALLGL